MLRKTAIILVLLLVALAAFAYYRISVGVIEPHEIYPEALGQTKDRIESRLGKPRRLNDIGNGLANAFWQGREPFSWIYSIWYLDGIAVHVSMPNDLAALTLQDVRDRIEPTENWQIGSITYNDLPYQAWVNGDRSIVIFETPISFEVANSDSIFWE